MRTGRPWYERIISVAGPAVTTPRLRRVTSGAHIADVVNKDLKAGSYNIDFDAAGLSSGMYIYTITNGDFEVSKKMMLLK